MYNKKVLIESLKKLGSAKAPTQKKDVVVGLNNPIQMSSMKQGGSSVDKQLSVKKSNIQGNGLFINEPIRKGDIIGLAHINNQATPIVGKNHNHSENNPTAVNISQGNKRYLVAAKDLPAGTEITTNYRLQPELEQPEDFMRNGGMTPQKDGYRTYSPYKNLPYIDIDTDTIDTDNIVYDLQLVANNGVTKNVQKNTGLHKIPGASVIREIPIDSEKQSFKKGGGPGDRWLASLVKQGTRSNNLLTYPVKLAGERIARLTAAQSRTKQEILDALLGVNKGYEAKYFGEGKITNAEREKYGFGKRDLIANYFRGIDTGFEPTNYDFDTDAGLEALINEYGPLKAYLMNSQVQHEEPLHARDLLYHRFDKSMPHSEYDYPNMMINDPNISDNWNYSFHNYDADKTKENFHKLFDLYGKEIIPFDIQPDTSKKPPLFSFDYSPVNPIDNVAGHMAFLQRTPKNEFQLTTRDSWGFFPKNYDSKWNMSDKFKQRQTQLMDAFGKPFILTQNNPITFKKGGVHKTKNKNSRSYSRSLDATNKFFAENYLFEKPSSRKNKIYDPHAKYYQKGGEQECTDDGRCEETDKIQDLYDKGSMIPIKNVGLMWDVVDKVNPEGKQPGNAGKVWKSMGAQSLANRLGVSNPNNCTWASGSGYQCLDDTRGKINKTAFESNDKFLNAVSKHQIPFSKVTSTNIPNFDSRENNILKKGDIITMKGKNDTGDSHHPSTSHAMTFSHYREDGTPIYLDSNGDEADFNWNSGIWSGMKPNKKRTAHVSRFDPRMFYADQINSLEEKARTNPTYINTELTQDQINEYAKGGYIIEDISVPELDKAQEGGEQTVTDTDKDYYTRMANSPLFVERYARMVGKPIDQVGEEAEAYRQQILNNIETVKINDVGVYPVGDEGQNPENLGEYHPLIDFGPMEKEIDAIKNRRTKKAGQMQLDFEKDFNNINAHNVFLYNNDPWTRTHELSHASVKGKINDKNVNTYPFRDLNVARPLKRIIRADYYQDDPNTKNYYENEENKKYYQKPDEQKARIDVARKYLESKGLYDPVNEPFTEKHYNDIIEELYYEEPNGASQQLNQITFPYDKETVIKMFNDFVEKEPTQNSNLVKAEQGGSTDYELGDTVDKATMERLKKLGYTFEII